MELFKSQLNVNFLGLKRLTGFFSIGLVLASLLIMGIKGLNFGMEFTGGVKLEMTTENVLLEKDIVDVFKKEKIRLFDVGYLDNDKNVFIKFDLDSDKLTLENNLNKYVESLFKEEKITINKVEFVGSEVGEKLAEQGVVAVIIAILATMIYIAVRFEYRLAISAALALVHDAIIILGIFSLFQIEFDLSTLASILAVIGYSLNDTIVVFDRIRENFRIIRQGNVQNIINISINQTLSRTIITSILTLVVVLALLFLGGDALFGFSLALTIGITIGTYSSIYVAGVIAVSLGLTRDDMLPKLKTSYDHLP